VSNSSMVDDRVMDGVSLKNTLFELEPSKRKKIIYYRSREVYAIRYGEYKAHFITQGAFDYPAGSDKKIVLEKPLLYNLNIDPSEKYDIAHKNPDILEKINAILEEHKKNLIPTKDLLIERGLELSERAGE